MTMLADFGITVEVTVHTDASAAIGIVRRAGLGKLRHLNVRYLWLQDQVKKEAIGLEKVAGAHNPADLGTKHLNAETMLKHLVRVGARTSGGRASSAPTLGVLGTRRRGHRGGESQRLSALRRRDGGDQRQAARTAASSGEQRSGWAPGSVTMAKASAGKACETEELKRRLGESRGKLRELAAKFASHAAEAI